jgi:hypothetical protein
MLSRGVKKKSWGAEYKKRRAEKESMNLKNVKNYECAEIFFVKMYRERHT